MAQISEQEFEEKDPNNSDYSMTEYDLYARLNMTLVKNHKLNRFEILNISDRSVQFFGTFEEMVEKANELEGTLNSVIK